MDEYVNYLISWLKSIKESTHTNGMIVGMSGGIDSAVTAGLLKKALGDDCFGLILPCHSNPIDEQLARRQCEEFNLKYEVVDLTKTYDALVAAMDPIFASDEACVKASQINTKVRLRMVTLYAYAAKMNYLVCGTDNADEWFIGYFTKFGDGGVDLVPLIHLNKSEVVALALKLKVIEPIISRPPTAGLFVGQTDEGEIGVSYNEIDSYLAHNRIDPKKEARLEYLHKISEHKRNLAYHPKGKDEYK